MLVLFVKYKYFSRWALFRTLAKMAPTLTQQDPSLSTLTRNLPSHKHNFSNINRQTLKSSSLSPINLYGIYTFLMVADSHLRSV